MNREMFHTQEKRQKRLTFSICCERSDAWFGTAHYFWYYEEDAVAWGIKAKRRYGAYSVYKATIDCKNVLDTVFNEENYIEFAKMMEKVKKFFAMNNIMSSNHEMMNLFLREKCKLEDLYSGVMFHEVPINEENKNLGIIMYRKRIQLAVFDTKIISTFAHYFDSEN